MTLSTAAGSSATAAFVDSIAPAGVIKPTNESVTSSTTLQNDNDLVVPLAASATYLMLLFLDYEAANGGDLKLGFTAPAGAVIRGTASYLAVGGTVAVTWAEITQSSTTISARGNGAGSANSLGMTLIGSVVMSTTAGNLQLQWAQNTSSGTATIVHAGSALTLFRLS